ncbi:MAG TPA: DHHA1 domain-containing protein [Patescibacteria group bacterium]|jgi:alanyl-tRNA synthetase|nr:DHHA1 domain-containing protein [Patescibacteria group bacterium]
MTVRQYYDDSYCIQFKANVVEHMWLDRKPAVILNSTYFYPSSGGQPNDLGTIQKVNVTDVLVRESDHQIIHSLSEEIVETEVVGEIDWSRRFDHMQQHSGQHILSQAFLRIADVETISFHLSQEASTLDLATNQLSISMINESEFLANRILWEDRRVHIKYVSVTEALSLPLRKTSDRFGDSLRLIEVEDFDLSACGGTHVARTGEVGLIKITKTERRANGLRIEFRCGQRALDDYRNKSQVVGQLVADLTTATGDLPDSVQRLREQIKTANRQIKRQTNELITLESTKLVQDGTSIGSAVLVSKVFENRDPAELRILAKKLVNTENTVAFLGIAGNKSYLVFSAANNIQVNMDTALNLALPELASPSGGGSAKFAQGGGGAASKLQVVAAIDRARHYLIDQIKEIDNDSV